MASNKARAPADVLTPAGRRALERAAKRERGNVCPTGCRGASEQPMLERLLAAGFITDTRIPFITEAGRAAIARMEGKAREGAETGALSPEHQQAFHRVADRHAARGDGKA